MDRCADAQQENAAAFPGLDLNEEEEDANCALPDEASLPLYWEDDKLFRKLPAEAEHLPPAKGRRAVAKSAVEGLSAVVIAEVDTVWGSAQCLVCKDGIEAFR